MAGNDVHIKIVADKPNTVGIKQTNEDIDKLKTKAKETIPVIDGMTKSIGDSGKGLTETDKRLGKLNDSIAISKDKLTSLAHSFAQTNDAAQKIDISKSMTKVQKDINDATKAKKIIMDIAPDIKPQSLERVTSEITGSVEKAGATMPEILGGAAVVAAPLIGGLISAAIIGGAGIGAVGIGVALAAQDDKVQAAARRLGITFMTNLRADTSVFIDPLLKEIDKIGLAFQAQRGKIKSIFSGSVGFLDPLTTGVTSAIGSILDGVDRLVSKGGPVINAFGRLFSTVGDSIDTAFTSISGSSAGAADAVDDIAKAIGYAVESIGFLVTGLAKIEEWSHKADAGIDSFRHSLEDALSFGDKAGMQFDITADGMTNMQRKAVEAAAAQSKLAQANNDLVPTIGSCVTAVGQNADAATIAAGAIAGYSEEVKSASGPLESMASAAMAAARATNNLFDAATSVAEAEDNLTSAMKKNGTTLDVNTSKGRANRTALSSVVSALNAQYKAFVDVNGEGSRSNQVAASNYRSFIHTATAAGISASAARNYARELGLIPARKATSFTANTHDAAARIQALKEKINSVHGKTVTLTVRTVMPNGNVHVSGPGGSGTQVKFAHGGIKGSASGATPNGLTWVGEQGPELADIPAGSRVWSAGDSARMASGASAGSDPVQVIVSVKPGAGTDLLSSIVTALRFDIARKGSGSVQKHLGQTGRS